MITRNELMILAKERAHDAISDAAALPAELHDTLTQKHKENHDAAVEELAALLLFTGGREICQAADLDAEETFERT